MRQCLAAACLALAASLLPAPAAAQQPEPGDGFFNIAGDPDIARETVYGEARGWLVVAGFTGGGKGGAGGFGFCAAETDTPEGTWRFGHDAGGQWQMALRDGFTGRTPDGTFAVDGRTAGITGWGDGTWVVLWNNLPEYEAIARGSRLDLALGPVRASLGLYGTAAAALKVQECVQNRGVAPAVSREAVLMPDPAGRGETFIAECRTPYASYRCLVVTLSPTGRFGEAMLVEDPLGTEPAFIMQTDRADLSQVWVSFDGAEWRHLGDWSTADGRCRTPLPDQPRAITAALGHDAWELCVQ